MNERGPDDGFDTVPGSLLATMLEDRVAGVHPDLAARVGAAVRAGCRLRRRRRAGTALAATAGLAAVATVGLQVNAGVSSGQSPGGFAAHQTRPHGLGGPALRGPHGRAPSCDALGYVDGGQRVVPSDGAAAVKGLTTSGKGYARLQPLHRLDPGDSAAARLTCLQAMSGHPVGGVQEHTGLGGSAATGPEQLPVTLQAPGWTCTPPGDEKFLCTSGDNSVQITVRPADERDAYLDDPDKADPSQYVSPVHGDVFATILPSPGSGDVDADQLGGYLVWS